ncbi:carbohydrate sulfotransferase 14-like [Apostichopus japonicus]|uniref:carbohydrate sulfotransferase 14-like n=1 Tax=Stichopus japonicus TaxID=307972 RepID=UPI003AB7F019
MEFAKVHFLSFILISIVMGLITYNGITMSTTVLRDIPDNGDNEFADFYPRPQAVPGVEQSLELWQEQTSRLERLQGICKQLNRTQTYTPPKGYTMRLLVDDTNHVLFGYIPKVGCTTWKGVFGRIRRAHGGNRPDFSKLSQFNDTEREKRLREYKKVLFVRDPVIRLLSAYLSKFTNLRALQKTWENMYGFDILKRYRPGSEDLLKNNHNLPRSERTFMNVTLTEFIRFVTDRGDQIKLHEISDHWLPQHIVSHVCEIGFDFIGKYENLAVEAPFVLNWLGLTSVAGFPEVHASKASSFIADEYAHVPLIYIQALQKYYMTDFQLFGYSSTGTVLKIANQLFDIDHID